MVGVVTMRMMPVMSGAGPRAAAGPGQDVGHAPQATAPDASTEPRPGPAARARAPARRRQRGGRPARRAAGRRRGGRPRGPRRGRRRRRAIFEQGAASYDTGRVRQGVRPVHARLRAQPPRRASCSREPRPCGGSVAGARRRSSSTSSTSTWASRSGRPRRRGTSRSSRRRSRRGTSRPTRRSGRPPSTTGAKLYEQGDFAHAYDEFTKAWELTQRPGLLFSRAQALRRLGGRREEAIALYEAYIALGDGERDAEANQYIAELATPESTGDLDKDIEVSKSIFDEGRPAVRGR